MRNLQHPIEEELSAYIDDMLDVPTMRTVAEHVAECDACRVTCLAFHRNKERMRQMAKTPAESADFWAKAYTRLNEEQISGAGEARKPVPTFRTKAAPARLKWAYSLAATIVAATVIVSPHLSSRIKIGQHSHAPIIARLAAPDEADAVDVSQLVWDHTSAASQQPLADPERQAMLAADSDNTKPDATPGSDEVL